MRLPNVAAGISALIVGERGVTRIVLLFVLLLAPSIVCEENAWTGHGTLVLVAFARDGVVVAGDSGTASEKGGFSFGERKVDRAGQFGAMAFVGSRTAIQNPKTHRLLSLPRVAIAWEMVHADIPAEKVPEEMSKYVAAKATKFIRQLPYIEDPGPAFFKIIFVGYDSARRPFFRESHFSMQRGSSITYAIKKNDPIPPGVIRYGMPWVCSEVLEGKSPDFQNFKEESAVKQYRTAEKQRKLRELTVSDYLAVFDVCFGATESFQAQSKYPMLKMVGPPNPHVVVNRKTGVEYK